MRGWLHTRYAPVRHSQGPEGPFPFDLHVLGLPLAFILSQDQTLHCSIVFLNFLSCLGLRYDFFLFLASYAGLKLSKNFVPATPFFLPSFSGPKTAAKVQPFFQLAMDFSNFFSKIFLQADSQ